MIPDFPTPDKTTLPEDLIIS
ncbi:hypothetical protein VAE122_3920002 [Vibrio aestuarianus]|nr:hypothetical protein VAE122_3920002 [Vibrio aestuarianus]